MPPGRGRLFTRPLLILLAAGLCRSVFAAEYVIHISVDGFGSSYLQTLLDLGAVTNFQRLRSEGTGTLNARTDFDYTITLPNHTSMVTGRPVLDKYGDLTSGHLWEENYDPGDPVTLDSNRGFHLSSTFEVAHDSGLSTALYSSKPKFAIYDRSYDAAHGTPDVTGADNGTDKIDFALITDFDSIPMMATLVSNMTTAPANYTFLHFHDTDSAGHGSGWGSETYMNAIKTVDGYLGEILDVIDHSPTLSGHTAIVLTTDHGGDIDYDHSDPTKVVDYTIPFLAWGDGVASGYDLYALNATTRIDPGTGRPDYAQSMLMPVRNGDSGNLALDLLGLNSIPGSSIDNLKDLTVAVPEPAAWSCALCLGLLAATWRRRRSRPGRRWVERVVPTL